MPDGAIRSPLARPDLTGGLRVQLAVLRACLLIAGAGLLLGGTATAQTLPDHTLLDRVLRAYVRDDRVDYADLAAHRTDLDAYVELLGRTSPTDLELASRDERLAFWINAYNACALRLVVDHYPIDAQRVVTSLRNQLSQIPANSIRQIPDARTRQFCRVAQRERSLDGIEHGIIRPMGEPRSLFALYGASRSGPALAPEAYGAGRLGQQLDAAVRRFLADPQRYGLERGTPPVVRVSKIFDWYKDDFGGTGGVVAFLRGFVPAADAELLQPGQVRVEYGDYDWTLDDASAGSDAR